MLSATVQMKDVVLRVGHEHRVGHGVDHPPQPLFLDRMGLARTLQELHVLLAGERSARLARERSEPLQVRIAHAARSREEDDCPRSVAAAGRGTERRGHEAADAHLGERRSGVHV